MGGAVMRRDARTTSATFCTSVREGARLPGPLVLSTMKYTRSASMQWPLELVGLPDMALWTLLPAASAECPTLSRAHPGRWW